MAYAAQVWFLNIPQYNRCLFIHWSSNTCSQAEQALHFKCLQRQITAYGIILNHIFATHLARILISKAITRCYKDFRQWCTLKILHLPKYQYIQYKICFISHNYAVSQADVVFCVKRKIKQLIFIPVKASRCYFPFVFCTWSWWCLVALRSNYAKTGCTAGWRLKKNVQNDHIFK